MEKELAGMYHGIGTATTYTCYGLVQNSAYAVFNCFLYCWHIGLSLPASVIISFVAYLNKISQRVVF